MGGYTVELLGDRSDNTNRSYEQISNEVCEILQFNQVAGEIVAYWAPGLSTGAYGVTFYPKYYPGINQQNEGIMVPNFYFIKFEEVKHGTTHIFMECARQQKL